MIDVKTKDAGPGVRGADAASLGEYLRARAGSWFGAGAAARVVLKRVVPRPASTLYLYDVELPAGSHGMLVKMYSAWPEGSGFRSIRRPRLSGALDGGARCRLEHSTLSAVHDHVGRLGDARLRAVRVFDVLPEHRAVVMERVPHPNLRDTLAGAWLRRGHREGAGLEPAFRNAGAWLRAYQGLRHPSPEHPRHSRREHHVRFVARLSEFLARQIGDARFFARVAGAVARRAELALPDPLPLGPGHGDYAMRNVLVEPDLAVAVIDATGRWRVPVYEDVGRFLADLECNKLQVLTRGLAPGIRTAACRRAFLEGYFGDDEVPTEAVTLFEVGAILDKWCSVAARRPSTTGGRFAHALRLGSMSRHCLRLIEERLPEVSG